MKGGNAISVQAVASTASFWVCKHRRNLRGALVTSVVTPLVYLVGMGVLLGRLVDTSGGGRYLDFVAPGLLAATAMQVAANESLFPVTTAQKWEGTYDGMLSSSLSPTDVFWSHFCFNLIRVAESVVLFLAAAVALGAMRTWWALLTVPAGLLCGAAFAAPIMAYALFRKDESSFNNVTRFVIVPLFLASGVFFPLDRLPAALTAIAWLSPLSHATNLTRLVAQGRFDLTVAGHAGYLVAVAAVGVVLARRSFRRRLAP